MISLTERQDKISQYLFCATQPVEIEQISKIFNISKSSVYYDLRRIEVWAKIRDISFQRHPQRGVLLEKDSVVREKMLSLKIPSPQKRQNILLINLILSSNYLTAQEISDDLGVSRNTILQDIKAIRKQMLPNGIKLVGLRSHGYVIQGNEFAIRLMATQQILTNSLTYDLLSVVIKGKLAPDPEPFLKFILSKLQLEEVKIALKQAGEEIDFWLPDMDYVRFIVYQSVSICRMQAGKWIIENSSSDLKLQGYDDYLIAKKVSRKLGDIFQLTLSPPEIFHVSKMLLSCNIKTRENNIKLNSLNDLLGITVKEMIKAITPYTRFDRKAYKKLEHNLVEHLRLTLRQLQFGVLGENTLLDTIKVSYSQSYLLAEKMAKVLREMMDINLPEGEVGYLALHVAVYLEVTKKNPEKMCAVVICNGGIGAANILSKKLKIFIPELLVKGSFSILDIEERDDFLEDVDLIISTINYDNQSKPVLIISPLLSDSEITIIKNFIRDRGSWTGKPSDTRQDQPMLNALYSRLEQRIDRDTVKVFREELEAMGLFYNDQFIVKNADENTKVDQNELIAFISLDAMEMVKTLDQTGQTPTFEEVMGLLIHIIMAIGRWKRGEYVDDTHLDQVQQAHPAIWNKVNMFLTEASGRLGQTIPASEGVAIMRYLT